MTRRSTTQKWMISSTMGQIVTNREFPKRSKAFLAMIRTGQLIYLYLKLKHFIQRLSHKSFVGKTDEGCKKKKTNPLFPK